MKTKHQSAEPGGAATTVSLPSLRVSVKDLFQGRREIILDHEGNDYRLRLTASGKLILTK